MMKLLQFYDQFMIFRKSGLWLSSTDKHCVVILCVKMAVYLNSSDASRLKLSYKISP